jgi:hypothetical protein
MRCPASSTTEGAAKERRPPAASGCAQIATKESDRQTQVTGLHARTAAIACQVALRLLIRLFLHIASEPPEERPEWEGLWCVASTATGRGRARALLPRRRAALQLGKVVQECAAVQRGVTIEAQQHWEHV